MDNNVKELRNTPLGHLTKIGRLYYSAIIFSPRDGYVDKVCGGCSFSEEGGAKDCKYSSACMAHLRTDKRSVIFVKINRS